MATSFAASFFDGKTSRAHDVQVYLDPASEQLHVRGTTAGEQRYPLTEIKIEPRVGNTPRFIYFEDGASLETEDNDAVDGLVPALPHGRFHLAQHLVESKLRWIVAMVLLAIAFGWGTIEYAIPYAAKQVAFALPRDVDEKLGEGAMAALDQLIFEPTKLDSSDRFRIREGFQELASLTDLPQYHAKLTFRASPVMGANALALPSGLIVMTDELVDMARDDDEILAVLAHELGHVRERHSLRSVLQNSTIALAIASLTGDLASLTSISATIPTLIVQLKYSRGFELEADDYAVELMRQMKIDPRKLGDILIRMTTAYENGDPDEDGITDYLSTHPGSNERMKRILERLQ